MQTEWSPGISRKNRFMLQAINDRIKGWLGVLVVILIGLPFALWGIQSYLDDSGPHYVAKVNDVEISAPELEFTLSLQRQKLLQQNEGKLPVDDKTLRKQVLRQLVNQRLLEAVSYDEGYRIPDGMLANRIKTLFTVDGKFDQARVEQQLAAMGRTPQQFEYELRNEMRVQQYQTGFAVSSYIPDSIVRQIVTLEDQKRQVAILTFYAESFGGNETPSEDAIKSYYEANRQQFMLPEKVKVDYVEIRLADLAKDTPVDEARVQEMYEAYKASVADKEQRKARHILITSDGSADGDKKARETIEKIKKQLDKGADFAKLAQQYSQDPGSAKQGGDLGWVATGDMVKPFEQALFALKKGQTSDIVKTRFGYHLIRLDDIRQQAIAPLAEKRAGFEAEIRKEEAKNRFYDLSEELANKAYENPDSLDAIVDSMGLPLKTSEFFDRNKGKGIASSVKVRNVAFSPEVLEEGVNSDVVEVSPEHIVVLRLNEHREATPIPLDSVRDKVVAILRTRAGVKKTMAAAEKARARLEAGESVEAIKGNGISLDQPKPLGRLDFTKVPDPNLIGLIFEMPAPVDGKPVIKLHELSTGDVALVVLQKVVKPEKISDERMTLVRSQLRQQMATDEFSAIMKMLKARADIDINKRLLE